MILLLALACSTAEPVVEAPAAIPPDPAKAVELRAAAMTAYDGKDYAGCADRYAEALPYDAEGQTDAYNAACCAALAGRKDDAFGRLGAAADLGYRNPGHLAEDADLASLRDDPRWEHVSGRVKANEETFLASIDRELYAMFQADQSDRKGDREWDPKRDDERRARTEQILAEGGAKASIDWYHAAMIYQHGPTADDARKAHELAMKALETDPPHEPARWLAAAAEDRALWRDGKPQKWGTQYVKDDAGKWILWEVDPATTDEERAKWNVRPIAEQRKRAEAMNQPKP